MWSIGTFHMPSMLIECSPPVTFCAGRGYLPNSTSLVWRAFSKILRILGPFTFMTLTVGTTGFGLFLLYKGKCGECEICLHFVQALSSSGTLDTKTGNECKLVPAPLGDCVPV